MRGKRLTEEQLSALIEQFLSSEKMISNPIQWKTHNHPDFLTCRLPVFVPDEPRFNSQLILLAHQYRLPRKYSFTLLLGDIRVFSLDVNPARLHNNRAARVRVECTHWAEWPCEEVEADDRDLNHRQWLHELCERARIKFEGSYDAPPFIAGEQPKLL